MSQIPGSDDARTTDVTIVESGPDREVVVRAADLLHCMQVAIWRAGLLDGRVTARLREGLAVDEIPKPSPAIRVPEGATMKNITAAGAGTGMRTFRLPEPITGPGLYEFSVDMASGRVIEVRRVGD